MFFLVGFMIATGNEIQFVGITPKRLLLGFILIGVSILILIVRGFVRVKIKL